ncbi:hypothetical protein F3G58_34490 [Pseudomonas aeruginosa]|nr:hypothetical protein F3G58_34490 [Pseudomonas aeruginosa]
MWHFRSVKYMCALAAGKWIVSFEWVEKCLHLKKYVDEVSIILCKILL